MILAALKMHDAGKLAVQTDDRSLSYGQLIRLTEQFAQWLEHNAVRSLALLCDNSPEWVIVDLACQQAGTVLTPVPLFFSAQQISHLIKTAKPDLLLSDNRLAFADEIALPILPLHAYPISQLTPALIPQSSSKITYTSGSTGEPKGVCLSIENQLNVAQSLCAVTGLCAPKHLSLLPLSTLLENIAGIYSPLLAGGSVYLACDQQRGFEGSRLTHPEQLFACIDRAQPNSFILVPQLLQVLIDGAKKGWKIPATVQFIAVGGAKVTPSLLASARELGLPVFQGYGLSECASVVSLQTPECSAGSAGKLLPHLTAKVSDGQLVVCGNTFLGYLNNPDSWGANCLYTGDIAEICNNEVFIKGRKKNLIINSFGRNISPEWVEAELLASGLLQQAVVIGDSQPYCIALIVTLAPQISEQQLAQAIASINLRLPDYAQIKNYLRLHGAMRYEDGLMTANNRPKREAITHHFKEQIAQIYALQTGREGIE